MAVLDGLAIYFSLNLIIDTQFWIEAGMFVKIFLKPHAVEIFYIPSSICTCINLLGCICYNIAPLA